MTFEFLFKGQNITLKEHNHSELYALQRTEVCYVETFCKSYNEGKIWSNPDPSQELQVMLTFCS